MRANWKLLMENTIDIYHLDSTHGRYMRDYVPKVLGLKPPDPRTAHEGARRPEELGNGHVVLEYRKFRHRRRSQARVVGSPVRQGARHQDARLYQDVVAISEHALHRAAPRDPDLLPDRGRS